MRGNACIRFRYVTQTFCLALCIIIIYNDAVNVFLCTIIDSFFGQITCPSQYDLFYFDDSATSFKTVIDIIYVHGGPKKDPTCFGQNSTKFDKFWHADSQDDRIMYDTLIVHII